MRRLVMILMALLFYEAAVQGQTWFSQRRWDVGLVYNNYSFNAMAKYNARKGAWRAFASYRPLRSRIIADTLPMEYDFINEYNFSLGYEKYLARYDNFFSYYGADIGYFHTLLHYKQDRVFLRPFIGAGIKLGRMSLFLEQSFYISNIKLPSYFSNYFTNGITAYSAKYVVGFMYNLGREKSYEVMPYARNWEIILTTKHKKRILDADNWIIFIRNLTENGGIRIKYDFNNSFTAGSTIRDYRESKIKMSTTMLELFNNLKIGYQYYFFTHDIGYKRYKTTLKLYTGFDTGIIVNAEFNKGSIVYFASDSTVSAKYKYNYYGLSSDFLLGARLKLSQRFWLGYEYNLIVLNYDYYLYHLLRRNYSGQSYPGNFTTSFFYLSILL